MNKYITTPLGKNNNYPGDKYLSREERKQLIKEVDELWQDLQEKAQKEYIKSLKK